MKKIKEFSKKYLIGFTLGLITSGIVVVCAATYFPSNQTTYDNSVSGLNATNVQTAIDELYNTCFPPTAGDTILDSVPTVTTGDGLYKDENENRYFYRGKNPNNYITFNNETWRIISIENDGTIKVMRENSIGMMAWDSGNENNWSNPADLNTYLNGTYLTSTLNSTAQSQIVSKDWSIGAVTENNNDLSDQINDENSKKWNGKVALVTISEYLRTNSNKSNCGTFIKYASDATNCDEKTWMPSNNSNITYWWTLSSLGGDSFDAYFDVYAVSNNYGYIDHNRTGITVNDVRPSVYLSSKIKITDGTGTSTDPYQISL